MRFLSEGWLAAADRVARATEGVSLEGGTTVIEYQVADPAQQDAVYQIVLGPSGAGITPGSPQTADVVLSTTYAAAASLGRGEIQSYEAIRRGLIKVSGRPNALIACQPALRLLNEALHELAGTTEY